MKLDMQTSIPGTNRVLTGQVEEKGQRADVLHVSMDEKPTEVEEVVQPSRTRSNGGNRDPNTDLEIKADELEKLFAEHMLRSASAPRRRSVRSSSAGTYGAVKPVTPAEPVSCPSDSGIISREGSVKSAEFDAHMLEQMVANNEDSCNNSSRGKHYEKYMQIRDAKLAEEWRSRGAAKEAHLKAMQEQLEHCWGLTKSRSSLSSSNSQDGDLERAAELKRLTACAIEQNEQQSLTEVWETEAGDDTEDLNEELESDQDRSTNGMLSNNSKSQSLKNNLPSSKNATCSVSQTLATSSPRSTTKPVNSSGRRVRRDSGHRMLSQSLPNVSDLRKGNGGRTSRTTPLTKLNYHHNRSTGAKRDPVQDDYAGRSGSMGESSNLVGSNDVSYINSSDSTVMPLLGDSSESRSVQKSVESRPFLRKGKGIGPGAGAVVVKRKTLVALENLKIKEKPGESHVETEGSSRELNHEGDEFKMGTAEEASMAEDESKMASDKEASTDKYESKSRSAEEASITDDENHRPSTGSGGNADSEYSDVLELNPPMQISSLPVIITSKGSSSSTTMPESTVESPMSFKSNIQHNFACAQQASHFDAFVVTPIGSSALGNLIHLDQITESDAASMSTESGIAHKHVLAGSTPPQTKINVAKSFKRLLKLGKKSKRHDPLVNDWVSSPTNFGGDDNMDDNCDQGRQTPRIGLSQNYSASDDTKLEEISNVQGETFNCSSPVPPDDLKLSERHPSGSHPKTPRSFFSLSTFRVKRSNSKLR